MVMLYKYELILAYLLNALAGHAHGFAMVSAILSCNGDMTGHHRNENCITNCRRANDG